VSVSPAVTGKWARVLERVERAVVILLIVLLTLVICVALVDLYVLFVMRVGSRVSEIRTAGDFQQALQNAFGGVLMVLLGLELLETVKVYFQEHRIRVEIIMFVAIIATGRHIIQIDTHNADPLMLFGLAALMLALSTSYFLLKRGAGRLE
jgi:uncharacterized membrane protein (DUF373 family)